MGKYKHGYYKHPLYYVWQAMRQRCYNTKNSRYGDYGGRGISVCQEWQANAKTFIEWALGNNWQKGLFLDRIDNDGNYTPQNCRFVEPHISSINTRLKKNNTSGYKGVYYQKLTKLWMARLSHECENIYIGMYIDKESAVKARIKYIIENNLPREHM